MRHQVENLIGHYQTTGSHCFFTTGYLLKMKNANVDANAN